LFLDVEFSVTLMTTRLLPGHRSGSEVDAVSALEAMPDRYDLKPRWWVRSTRMFGRFARSAAEETVMGGAPDLACGLPAGRCAAAGRDLSRQHRGIDGDDYSEVTAGVARGDDEAAFAARLAAADPGRDLEGSPIGFRIARSADTIDLLYVSSGRGQGAAPCCSMRSAADGRASSHAIDGGPSDSARDFFGRRGFQPQRRNTVSCHGEGWRTPPWKSACRAGRAKGRQR